ncbi:hypothetical protein SLS62_000533 [Diatrype stigma]|uniref:Kelch repeat-containing protein n=1 Tax=Diatrype stigma TaxID=117547 RepID=A0AAN9YSL7_9PEZI
MAAVNDTFYIPLTQSWTNSTAPISVIPKTATPVLDSPALWVDESTSSIFLWGGLHPYGNGTNSRDLWRLRTDGSSSSTSGSGGGEWQIERPDPTNIDVFLSLRRIAYGAATTCGNLGFSLGGFGGLWTDAKNFEGAVWLGVPVTGMLTYDMSLGIWANESTLPSTESPGNGSEPEHGGLNDAGTFIHGSIVCLPGFGSRPESQKEGTNAALVLALGGSVTRTQDGFDVDFPTIPRLDCVSFWDVETKTWHYQRTTGDIPSPRSRICAVAAHGNGTYEVFVFGGNDANTMTGFWDVYVLSIPGFVWFKAEIDEETAGGPRIQHGCALAGNRQMIVVGGLNPTMELDESRRDKDPWANGIGVFDISKLSWSSEYDAQAEPYESPDVVKRWYSAG